MKRYFYLLLFISFVFLFVFLVRQEYIIPEIIDSRALILSFLFLFAGFYASTFSWFVALRIHGITHRTSDALVSHGLSVFAKYIPGKIWVILGRAGYLSDDKKGLKNRSYVSLMEQVVYLWAGFLISSVPTVIFYKFQWISYLVLIIFAGLTLFLFVERINHRVINLIKRIFKKELEVPLVRLGQSLPLIAAVSVIWILWTAGFYLFMMAFAQDITPVMMFAFPLSVCFGLIAIILPAGLGLREGIIIGYLSLAGLDLETATTISFFNRLWFISGELFIFLLATAFRVLGNRKRAPAN